jgi:iron complex transport system permease protein
MFMQFFATESQVAATLFWTFGDLGRGGFFEAQVTLFAALLFLGATMRLSFSYDAMAWGDHSAHGLGVSVKGLRVVSLLLAAFTTAVATSFYGVIGFVGLICPHMVRLALPRIRHEFLILFSSLSGGTFVLGADILAQRLLYPVSVPIGIISAFAGVPMFLALLIRGGIKDASRS